MNWLFPTDTLIAQVHAAPTAQRILAIGWLNELDAICERHVPMAPPPSVNHVDGAIRLSWEWQSKGRVFEVVVREESAALELRELRDPVRSHLVANPSHAELKRLLLAFFDGWQTP